LRVTAPRRTRARPTKGEPASFCYVAMMLMARARRRERAMMDHGDDLRQILTHRL